MIIFENIIVAKLNKFFIMKLDRNFFECFEYLFTSFAELGGGVEKKDFDWFFSIEELV